MTLRLMNEFLIKVSITLLDNRGQVVLSSEGHTLLDHKLISSLLGAS